MSGIVGYGAFIPRNRIKSEEIARQWGKNPETIQRPIGRREADGCHRSPVRRSIGGWPSPPIA